MAMKKLWATFIVLLLGALVMLFIIMGTFSRKKAALVVEAAPESSVFINGKYVGSTPYKYEGEPEEVLLTLAPPRETPLVYERLITLLSGTQTIVRRNFESEESSSGLVLGFSKAPQNQSFVEVVTVPDKSEVTVNGHRVGVSPVVFPLSPGEHDVSISAAGYSEEKIKITALRGYRLLINAELSSN